MVNLYFGQTLTSNFHYKHWLFPAGEVGIKIALTPKLKDEIIRNHKSWTLLARIKSSDDFFVLAQIKDAIEELCLSLAAPKPKFNLILPYVPYSRQDRVCDAGESFSLRVFCKLLNGLNFERVIVADPHSNMTPGLIDNCQYISQFYIIDRSQELRTSLARGILVAPDEGAMKKTAQLAKYFNHGHFVCASKVRNLATGQIIETILHGPAPDEAVIVDDLVDGGRTFIELAKVLKNKGSSKITLYCTHGIFSKGYEVLLENGIDRIFTTNSYSKDLVSNDKVSVVDIEPLLISQIPIDEVESV